MNIRRIGFTLAEVLITLGIIGIIAVLTVPSMVQNYQDKQTVAKVKKAYSTLSQAYKMAQLENGENPEDWDCSNFKEFSNASKLGNCYSHYISKHIKSIKYCEMDPSFKNCIGSSTTFCTIDGKQCSNISNGGGTNYIMADGTGVIIRAGVSIHYFVIKTDYKDAVLNKNLFYFSMTPEGLSTILYPGYDNEENLTSEKLKQGIISGVTQSGAHWIMTTDNMDYLHCDGLSIKGKTSCK